MQILKCVCWTAFIALWMLILRTDILTDEINVLEISTIQEAHGRPSSREEFTEPIVAVREFDNNYKQYSAGNDYPVIYSVKDIEHILTDKFYKALSFSVPADAYYFMDYVGNIITLTDYTTGNVYRVNFDGCLIETKQCILERSKYGRRGEQQ